MKNHFVDDEGLDFLLQLQDVDHEIFKWAREKMYVKGWPVESVKQKLREIADISERD